MILSISEADFDKIYERSMHSEGNLIFRVMFAVKQRLVIDARNKQYRCHRFGDRFEIWSEEYHRRIVQTISFLFQWMSKIKENICLTILAIQFKMCTCLRNHSVNCKNWCDIIWYYLDSCLVTWNKLSKRSVLLKLYNFPWKSVC